MVLVIGVCLWLAACTVCDLKWRAVPPTLTLPPLFGAVVWTALTGKVSLALFVLLLFILADVPFRLRGFANGLQVTIFCLELATSPEPIRVGLLMLAMFVIWSIWKLEKMGGADAQVLLALVLLCGPAVLLPIAVAGGIQGLMALLAHKKTMPFMASILAGACVFFLAQPPSF